MAYRTSSEVYADLQVDRRATSAMQDYQTRAYEQRSQKPSSVGQQVGMDDALDYLDEVKAKCRCDPNIYSHFLGIMGDFKAGKLAPSGVMERIFALFVGYPDLIIGFNSFLPAGYFFSCSMDRSGRPVITLNTPMSSQSYAQQPRPVVPTSKSEGHTVLSTAVGYISRVKARYQHDPATYQRFLELLEWCKQSNMKQNNAQLYAQVQSLFRDSPDLVDGFGQFLFPSFGM